MHAVRTSVALSLIVLSSCVFDGSNSANPSSSDAEPIAPDASTVDSGPTFDGAIPCDFPLDGVCATGGPGEGWEVVGADTPFDTTDDPVCRDFSLDDGSHACLVFVESFTVTSNATLRAIGTRPLLIASIGDILIDGTIDVSSYRAEQTGAGANYATCMHARDPEDDVGGAGGAAGGSFAGRGGDGGEGDRNENDGSDGKALPGLSDTAVSIPLVLRGGCPGGDGGDEGPGATDGIGGAGGASGGAVWLVGTGNLHVMGEGRIRATGAGGTGGGGQAGGGGGGSGGMIHLQAVQTIVDGAMSANGAGGAEGGVFNTNGNHGEDGMMAADAAEGGRGWLGAGNGGEGSSQVRLDGTNGLTEDAGGGGGGGGAGYIILRGVISGDGDSSPPPQQN